MIIVPDSTSVTLYFYLRDTVTGGPATGVTLANIDMTYIRDRAAAVKNNASALGSATAAFSANGVYEVDSTNAPGLYRTDWPDAAFASGSNAVQLVVRDGTGNEFLDVVDEVVLFEGGGGWDENIDSTGTETITASKALEAVLAVLAGDAVITGDSVSFKGRDGATEIVGIDVDDDSGSRSNSSVS